jgi:hypothetical protein
MTPQTTHQKSEDKMTAYVRKEHGFDRFNSHPPRRYPHSLEKHQQLSEIQVGVGHVHVFKALLMLGLLADELIFGSIPDAKHANVNTKHAFTPLISLNRIARNLA